MKILTNTPDLLVLDHKSWLLSLGLMAGLLIFLAIGITATMNGEWIFGVMFGGIGTVVWGGCLAVFTKRVQLIFDVRAGQVVARKRSVLGYKQDVYPLDTLRGAKLEESPDKEPDMHRPVLVLDGRPNFPLVSYYTNGSGPRRMVDAINAWVEQRSDPTQLDSAPQTP